MCTKIVFQHIIFIIINLCQLSKTESTFKWPGLSCLLSENPSNRCLINSVIYSIKHRHENTPGDEFLLRLLKMKWIKEQDESIAISENDTINHQNSNLDSHNLEDMKNLTEKVPVLNIEIISNRKVVDNVRMNRNEQGTNIRRDNGIKNNSKRFPEHRSGDINDQIGTSVKHLPKEVTIEHAKPKIGNPFGKRITNNFNIQRKTTSIVNQSNIEKIPEPYDQNQQGQIINPIRFARDNVKQLLKHSSSFHRPVFYESKQTTPDSSNKIYSQFLNNDSDTKSAMPLLDPRETFGEFLRGVVNAHNPLQPTSNAQLFNRNTSILDKNYLLKLLTELAKCALGKARLQREFSRKIPEEQSQQAELEMETPITSDENAYSITEKREFDRQLILGLQQSMTQNKSDLNIPESNILIDEPAIDEQGEDSTIQQNEQQISKSTDQYFEWTDVHTYDFNTETTTTPPTIDYKPAYWRSPSIQSGEKLESSVIGVNVKKQLKELLLALAQHDHGGQDFQQGKIFNYKKSNEYEKVQQNLNGHEQGHGSNENIKDQTIIYTNSNSPENREQSSEQHVAELNDHQIIKGPPNNQVIRQTELLKSIAAHVKQSGRHSTIQADPDSNIGNSKPKWRRRGKLEVALNILTNQMKRAGRYYHLLGFKLNHA